MGALACLAALAAATAAHAGVIRGTVWMGRLTASADGGALPDARKQRGVGEAVVFVDSIPDKAERALTTTGILFFKRRIEAGVHTVVQNGRFEPRVSVIPAGTRVCFYNLDRVYHNAFSVSPARRFDTGKNGPGRRDTVTFARAGTVNLHCDIHPDELGWVVVTPNHAFARPDSLGRFALPKLPGGTYTVRVVHPRKGEWSQRVVLPRRGDVVVDLAR